MQPLLHALHWRAVECPCWQGLRTAAACCAHQPSDRHARAAHASQASSGVAALNDLAAACCRCPLPAAAHQSRAPRRRARAWWSCSRRRATACHRPPAAAHSSRWGSVHAAAPSHACTRHVSAPPVLAAQPANSCCMLCRPTQLRCHPLPSLVLLQAVVQAAAVDLAAQPAAGRPTWCRQRRLVGCAAAQQAAGQAHTSLAAALMCHGIFIDDK